MTPASLNEAMAGIPPGAWAVGVSGGADSVALLNLLRSRDDLKLHVVHLDHQTRGEQSTGDARFVAEICAKWNLPCTIATRSEIEPLLKHRPRNRSAFYRVLRLTLFENVVRSHELEGVVLAHHADDQAETVLHRLLRGSGYAGLAGMSSRTHIGALLILRPLLGVRRDVLRQHLKEQGISWREDQSNVSPAYLRNRLRVLLAENPRLVDDLLNLSEACGKLRDWARLAALVLDEQPATTALARLPEILANESARRWLIDRGVPADQINPASIQRLLNMARDTASARLIEFPGSVRVRRLEGKLQIVPHGED